jgi:hypothetical protein
MAPKFPAATRLAVLLAVVTAGFVATPASAQTKRQQQYDSNGRPYYGANGPNRSYQQGPNTRVYITTRSWLDAGTEVLPGERKFMDYAFPSPYGYPDFAREKQPPDRPPAAQSAVRSRRLHQVPAVLRLKYRAISSKSTCGWFRH